MFQTAFYSSRKKVTFKISEKSAKNLLFRKISSFFWMNRDFHKVNSGRAATFIAEICYLFSNYSLSVASSGTKYLL